MVVSPWPPLLSCHECNFSLLGGLLPSFEELQSLPPRWRPIYRRRTRPSPSYRDSAPSTSFTFPCTEEETRKTANYSTKDEECTQKHFFALTTPTSTYGLGGKRPRRSLKERGGRGKEKFFFSRAEGKEKERDEGKPLSSVYYDLGGGGGGGLTALRCANRRRRQKRRKTIALAETRSKK